MTLFSSFTIVHNCCSLAFSLAHYTMPCADFTHTVLTYLTLRMLLKIML